MLKILLVDDEREEREGIAYLIKKFDLPLAAAQAQNGIKALEYMEHNHVDILFTDVKMPIMNGLELAKAVNEKKPGIKIIIFSAYGEFDYAKQALEANAVNYLLKPIEIDEFKKVMEEVICDITREQTLREERMQEMHQSIQNVFYKLLTGAHLKTGEQEQAEAHLFSEKESCRLIRLESAGNFFEKNEETFLNFVRMYLGEKTEYVNLFPNESYLIIREKKYMEREFLEGQLLKISRDIHLFGNEGIFIIAGRPSFDMADLCTETAEILRIQREFFGFGEMIVWTEKERVASYYAGDVEAVRRQLMQAVETNRAELIGRFTDELVDIIAANNMVSKIYVQNIFYNVIQAIYDKNPTFSHEKILNSSDAMFRAKNAKEMVSFFQNNVHAMLAEIREKEEDESGIIQKIKNLAEKEYMHDIGLDYVAGKVNLAPAYVSYIFKKETGKTLIKYLTEIKMEKAKLLLEEGDMKINQIAKACGYENPSYFNRAFKNYYGLTPKQFKER